MKLVYKQTGKAVKVGDVVRTFRGQEVEVVYFKKPASPASSGKISLQPTHLDDGLSREYYVHIIGAEWIDREDRKSAPTKPYYTLEVQFERGEEWVVEFGDFERSVVMQQIEDDYSEVYNTKIIVTDELA